MEKKITNLFKTAPQTVLATLITVLAVAGFASATTIGTNIITSGSLTVTGTTTIDGGTFYVDMTNNRVGIGSSTPISTLSVTGDIALSGAIDGVNLSDYSSYFINSAGTSGYLWQSDGTGAGAWVATSTLGLGGSGTVNNGTTGQFAYYNSDGTTISGTSSLFIDTSGNIGVGTSTPGANLQIYGGDNATSTIMIGGGENSNQGGCIKMKDYDGSGWTYLIVNDGTLKATTTPCN